MKDTSQQMNRSPAGLACMLAALLAATTAHPAVHYQSLKSFGSVTNDGQLPYAPVIQASDEALYGTTGNGGSNDAGTVFKLNKDGSGYSILHSFSTNRVDGGGAVGLVEASDGALYGTGGGGSSDAGTVFKLNKDGSGYGILHSFSTNGLDGVRPNAGLVEGSDGALYGTTIFGGKNTYGGTVFKL